jgi:hypothetical protein
MALPAELERLLGATRAAGPGERIEYRDPIAAFADLAVPELQAWLADARLGGFAVRTLERIAATPAHRRTVLAVLTAVDPRAAPEHVARDVSDAIARLGGSPATSRSPTSRRSTAVADWPGSRQVSALELHFHEDMLEIFRRAGEATRRVRPDGSVQRGYWASYFLRGVRNHGGPNYAHQLLGMNGTTPGFERLKFEGHLDLTMEALVLKPEYVSLFSAEERQVAAHRLAEAGYQPAGGNPSPS